MTPPPTLECRQWELPEAFHAFVADGELEIVIEIVDLFLEDAEKKMQFLAEAVCLHDLNAVRDISHSLKGALNQMGLLSLGGRAERLERNCAAMDQAILRQSALEMREEWAEEKQAVKATRERLASAALPMKAN